MGASSDTSSRPLMISPQLCVRAIFQGPVKCLSCLWLLCSSPWLGQILPPHWFTDTGSLRSPVQFPNVGTSWVPVSSVHLSGQPVLSTILSDEPILLKKCPRGSSVQPRLDNSVTIWLMMGNCHGPATLGGQSQGGRGNKRGSWGMLGETKYCIFSHVQSLDLNIQTRSGILAS